MRFFSRACIRPQSTVPGFALLLVVGAAQAQNTAVSEIVITGNPMGSEARVTPASSISACNCSSAVKALWAKR